MLGQRRLLYHRGVDDQAGTYISDYVLSSVSFLCAVCLAALIIGTKQAAKRWSPSPRPIPTTTCAVVLLLTFLGVLTLLGGLVHQYLQTVEPFRSVQEDALSWLVLWRTALAVSSLIVFAFLTYPQQLLVQENIFRPNRLLTTVYYIIVGSACAAVVIQSLLMLSAEDPFHAGPTFVALFVCSLLDCIVVSSVLAYRGCVLPSDQRAGCLDTLTPTAKERKLSDRSTNVSTNESDINEVLSPLSSDSGNTDVRWDLWLHVAASAIFVLGGLAQFLLGKLGCADHDDDRGMCPLPADFNHNAVLHLLHTFSVALFFIAEVLALRRWRRCYHPGRLPDLETPV